MMPFQGFLFGAVTKDEETGQPVVVPFPHQYLQLDSWKSTPNQREEIKAYRDDNTRDLTRVTSAGRKTAITFTTRANLHLVEKMFIQSFFTSYESNADERKIRLYYWNDETNEYKEGDFYRANTEFPISRIVDNGVDKDGKPLAGDIIYGETTIDLVEY